MRNGKEFNTKYCFDNQPKATPMSLYGSIAIPSGLLTTRIMLICRGVAVEGEIVSGTSTHTNKKRVSLVFIGFRWSFLVSALPIGGQSHGIPIGRQIVLREPLVY